jgi:hypothetical protein
MVTVLPESAVPADWRRLDESHGFPSVPPLALAIYTFQQSRLPVRQVTSFMRTRFSDVALSIPQFTNRQN